MKRLFRWGALLTGLAALVATSLFLWGLHRARASTREWQDRYGAQARQALPRLLTLQAEAARLPFFAEAHEGPDAGPFLNPRVRWEESPLLPRPDAPPVLSLPFALEEKLRALGPTWPAHAAEVDLSGLDFGWMQRLRTFGHWDLLTGDSPLGRLRNPFPTTPPAPDFRVLLDWAKLRLLRARSDGDWNEAAAEVEKLAWLSYSTELPEGALFATAFLQLEVEAHRSFSQAGVDLQGWRAPRPEEVALLRRAMLAQAPFILPAVPEEVRGAALASPIGRCAVLSERAWLLGLRRRLGAPTPWAHALESPTPPCRLTLARRVADASSRLPAAPRLETVLRFPAESLSLLERMLVHLAPRTALAGVEARLAPKRDFGLPQESAPSSAR